MSKILILGHNGMLGNAVHKYFVNLNKFEISIISERWPSQEFKNALNDSDADVIINCIGIIPQKKPDISLYKNVNIDLPIFLESLNKKIILPSTDCEFEGDIDVNNVYTKNSKRDASDEYGKSKAYISEKIEKEFKNTKIMRVSIIGHELKTNLSLLDWFLSQEGEVKGYENHLWNGITTLEWAKISEDLILNWDNMPKLNQHATPDKLSKCDILNIVKRVYNKEINIVPFKTEKIVNKCLATDKKLESLESMLLDLKKFYGK